MFIFVVFIINPLNVFADVMSSDNYKIFSDVLSVGGEYSTSTNYGLFDTVGEAATDPTTSTSSNYEVLSGFWGMSSSSVLSVSLTTASINLGTLTNSVVSSDSSQILTITTNAFNGYTTTIQADGALRSGLNTINAVGDGEVNAGSSEYGIRTTGTNGKTNSSDLGITTSAQTITQSTAAIIGDQVRVTYKASISGSVPTGSYGQTVTFTTTANF